MVHVIPTKRQNSYVNPYNSPCTDTVKSSILLIAQHHLTVNVPTLYNKIIDFHFAARTNETILTMNMTDKERGQNIQFLHSTLNNCCGRQRNIPYCYYVKMCRTGVDLT